MTLPRCCPAKGLAGLLWLKLLRQPLNNLDGFDAHANDLPYEADNVFGIVGAVGVGGDAGAFVGGDLVLVDDSFEGGAVAKAVVEGFGWDGDEGGELTSENQ